MRDVLIQHLVHGRAVERRRAGEHLIQHAAEGVQVDGGCHGVLAGLLGCHVPGGTDGHVRTGHATAVHVIEDEADAEVQDLYHAVGGEHHVGRLEVPVDYASPVGRVEAPRDLRADRGGPRDREQAVVSLGEQRVKGVSGDVLHRQVRQVAVEPSVDGARQVLARQPSHDAHLAGEPRGVLVRLGERHLLARAAPPHQLHRDGVTVSEIPGTVDLAHIAAGEWPEQLEPTCDDLGLRAAHDRLLPALLPTCRRCRATRGPSVA